MLCMGFETGATAWQAQKDPLSCGFLVPLSAEHYTRYTELHYYQTIFPLKTFISSLRVTVVSLLKVTTKKSFSNFFVEALTIIFLF